MRIRRKNTKRALLSLLSILFLITVTVSMHGCNPNNSDTSFIERIQPVPENSGFRMEGYWVWGGSLIKVDRVYHLFASRWTKDNEFPSDYRHKSEIVRATSDTPAGPYTFREVVIGERDSTYWDGNMAHNPTIHKVGDTYVLFYIGSDFTTYLPDSRNLLRRIGYATADDIAGPWTRSEQPVIDRESNNPAVLFGKDESVILMYRDAPLRIYAATAPTYKGSYDLKNDNVWPQSRLEDFYLFRHDDICHMICEDNEGIVTGHSRWGAHFVSEDGIIGWRKYDPVVVYDHDLLYDNGSMLHCVRRERPQLLIEDGKVTCLITSVYDGVDSWCQPVEIKPSY